MEHYLKKDIVNESEILFRALFEQSPAGIAQITPEGDFLQINRKFCDITGYSSDELLSMDITQITHPDDLELEKGFIEKVLNNEINEYSIEKRYKHKNKSIIWIRLFSNVIRNTEGEVVYAITTIMDITKEKKHEIELLTSEARYRQLVETASDAIYLLDDSGTIIDTNQIATQLLQKSKDEIIGSKISVIDPNFLVKSFLEFGKGIPFNESRIFESTHLNKNGDEIPVEINVKKFKIDDRTHYFGIARNITERKTTEKELKKQRDLFELVIDSVPARIFWKDLNSVYMGCNNHFIKDSGMKNPEDVIGKDDSVMVWKQDADKYRSDDKLVISTGKSKLNYEEEFLSSEGETIWWRTNKMPLRNSEGEIIGVIATSEDISKEKIAKDNLKRSEEKFRGIFKYANIGIALTDPTGQQIDVNDVFIQKLGYTKEECLCLSFADLSHPDDAEKESLQLKDISERLTDNYVIEKRLRKKDGDYLWFDVSIAARRHTNGEVDMFIAMASDITDRKKAETDLIEAKLKLEESDRLKTEFLHNMSHEIRTPMNGIMGFSDLFSKSGLNSEKRAYYASIVQNSSKQLLRIIDDILEISTLETKQLKLNEEQFSLNAFIMELFSIFDLKSKERRIPLYVSKALPDEQSLILTDKSKLRKILDNLLENALKFTSEGFIEFGYHIENSNLVIYVKDTGTGISTKNRELIFERFLQGGKNIASSHGGLGLGLSISKENAQLLGGDIVLDSEEGKGSTFFVTIPYKPVHNEIAIPKNEKKTYTVLIAEDEEVNYLYLEALLQELSSFSLKLIHAKNGKEAVDICLSNVKIHLVLMDIKMPVMNGYEATKKIRAELPDLPIIAQTAYSREADKENAIKHGCNHFISKPIDTQNLFELMAKYLKSK